MLLCFIGLFWAHSCTILGVFIFFLRVCVFGGDFFCRFLVVWLHFFLLVNLFLPLCQCAAGNGFPVEINAFDFCSSCYLSVLPSHHRGFCTDTEQIPRLGRTCNSCNNVLTACVHLFAFLNHLFKFCFRYCAFIYSVYIFSEEVDLFYLTPEAYCGICFLWAGVAGAAERDTRVSRECFIATYHVEIIRGNGNDGVTWCWFFFFLNMTWWLLNKDIPFLFFFLFSQLSQVFRSVLNTDWAGAWTCTDTSQGAGA